MSALSSFTGPLALYGIGFVLSLVEWLRQDGLPRQRPPGCGLTVLGFLLAIASAVWAVWKAAHAGVLVAILAACGAMMVFVLGAVVWIAVVGVIDDRQKARLFRRLRPELERLACGPAALVRDPLLREAGILSFEREGTLAWFAQSGWNDNGRNPDMLNGFLFAPDGPPEPGHIVPRSCGRHSVGARPFRLTSVHRIEGGPWWEYHAEEVWEIRQE